MRYRRLTQEELAELEDEFIRFLAVHTITAEDWQNMKTEDPSQCEPWIEQFSDFVFEKTLQGVSYMQRKRTQIWELVDVQSDPFQMRGLQVIGNPNINFMKESSPHVWQEELQQNGGKVQVFSAQKSLQDDLNAEKFQLMQQGFLILKDPQLFHTLASLEDD